MSRPLRVLFLAAYFPKPGNPLIGTWALAQAHALNRREDVEVRVVSCNAYVPGFVGRIKPGARAYAQCPPTHNWDGLRVDYPRWLVYPALSYYGRSYTHPEPYLRLGWLSVRRALGKAIREFKPDVVFAHHTGANGYLARKIERRFGLPYVVSDHLFNEITDCETMPARRETFGEILNNAARCIAVSRRMERDIARVFPDARAQTVPNGADGPAPAQWQTPRPPELLGKTIVVSVGMFYQGKGFPQLIEAWARVQPHFPNAVLRIAGDGDERPAIERAIAQSGVADSVELLGFVPHERIAQEMVWADAFALISRDEPFGVVFTEAMAARKPLIWPDGSGISELLRDGEHGYQVPPHDVEATALALEKLLVDAPQREQMGAANRALWEEKLTWDANAATMTEIFREATALRF